MELASFTFSLLVLFQLKHFLSDYILQGKYMLGKFKPGWGFLLPLLAHVGVHGIFTLGVVLYVAPHLWWLCLVDMSSHFFMDRVKAGPKYLGRFKPLTAEQFVEAEKDLFDPGFFTKYAAAKKKLRGNVFFWWSLGFDQMVHHLTDLYIVYVLVMDSILG